MLNMVRLSSRLLPDLQMVMAGHPAPAVVQLPAAAPTPAAPAPAAPANDVQQTAKIISASLVETLKAMGLTPAAGGVDPAAGAVVADHPVQGRPGMAGSPMMGGPSNMPVPGPGMNPMAQQGMGMPGMGMGPMGPMGPGMGMPGMPGMPMGMPGMMPGGMSEFIDFDRPERFMFG